MALSVEFRIPIDKLPLGSVLVDFDSITIELVRVIPTRDGFIPYFWVSGLDLDSFEAAIESHVRIQSLETLYTVDNERLYQVEWDVENDEFFAGLIDTEAAVLEAYTQNRTWYFHFRFPNHEQLSRFYTYCLDNEITGMQLDRVTSLTTRSNHLHEYGLTPEQQEAITLAAERGYFATPRAVTLAELATDLDISQQALSQRLRGATEKVVLAVVKRSFSD